MQYVLEVFLFLFFVEALRKAGLSGFRENPAMPIRNHLVYGLLGRVDTRCE